MQKQNHHAALHALGNQRSLSLSHEIQTCWHFSVTSREIPVPIHASSLNQTPYSDLSWYRFKTHLFVLNNLLVFGYIPVFRFLYREWRFGVSSNLQTAGEAL